MMKKRTIFTISFIILIVSTIVLSSGIISFENTNCCFNKIMAIPTIKSFLFTSQLFDNQLHEEWINERRFLWKEPSYAPPKEGYPVLFVLHGASQSSEAWFGKGFIWGKRQTQFTTNALARGFVIIAPDSVRPYTPGPKAWDAFTKTFNESADLQFIDSILNWLNTISFSINQKRLYCTGFSSGGFMTSRIATFFGSRFKAVCVHSGANADYIILTERGPEFDCISPQNFSSGYPSTLLIHGEKDRLVLSDCATHFYEELQRNNIQSKLILNPAGRHIWQSEFNNEILSWFEQDSYN